MLDSEKPPPMLDTDTVTEKEWRDRFFKHLWWYDTIEYGEDSKGFHSDSRGQTFNITPWEVVKKDAYEADVEDIVRHFTEFERKIQGDYANMMDHVSIDEVFGIKGFEDILQVGDEDDWNDADDWNSIGAVSYLKKLFFKNNYGERHLGLSDI